MNLQLTLNLLYKGACGEFKITKVIKIEIGKIWIKS